MPSSQLGANRGGRSLHRLLDWHLGTNDSPAVNHTMGVGMGGTEVYPVLHPLAYGAPYAAPYHRHGGNDTGNGNGGNGGGTHHQRTAPRLTPEVLSLLNRAYDHRYTPNIDHWAANAGSAGACWCCRGDVVASVG